LTEQVCYRLLMPDLRQALDTIRAFVRARGWEPFHDPKNLSMAVASEAGELVAELRWISSENADRVARSEPEHTRLTEEAADVAITLLMFCDRVGIDLEKAIPLKLAKNALKYPVTLPFEEPGLELMPWSARRALDHVGRKVSLEAWQALSLEARQRLAGLGSLSVVDAAAVRETAAGTAIDPFRPPDEPPAALSDAQGLWPTLSVVARHALHAYAARGKTERMREAYEALTSSGVSQSTK